MEPAEVIVPCLFFFFTFLILWKIIKNKHERRRWEYLKSQGGEDRSLTTSELDLMIEDAVAHATSELNERLERLERGALPPASPQDRTLEIPEPASKTLGRGNPG